MGADGSALKRFCGRTVRVAQEPATCGQDFYGELYQCERCRQADEAGALSDYDLFEDVIVKIRFEKLTKREQHDQLRRVVAWARERA